MRNIWQFKAMEYIAYIVVFAVPLYVGMNHWFPFSAPKAMLIHLFTFVMLILYVWGACKSRSMSLHITWMHWILGGFLAILTISSLAGVDVHNSFFGTWGQSISLTLLYSLGIFSCLLGFLIRQDRAIVPKLLLVSFIAGVVVALIAYGGSSIVSLSQDGSTLGNSSYAGAYLLVNVCFGIGLLFWYSNRWVRILIGIGALIIVCAPLFISPLFFRDQLTTVEILQNPPVIIGYARAAILGLLVALISMGTLFMATSRKKWIQISGLIIFVAIAGGVILGSMRLINPQAPLTQALGSSLGNRTLFWDIARSGFVERPILGAGFGNYTYVFQDHFKYDFFKPGVVVEMWTNQPHNVVWEYLSTTGILGTIAYMILFVSLFAILIIRGKRDEKESRLFVILAGGLIGYFVQNLFGFDVPATYFVLFLIIGIALGTSPIHKEFLIGDSKHKIIGGILGVIGVLGIIFFTILPWKESKEWLKLTDINTMVRNFERLNKLQLISPLGGIADGAFMMDKFFGAYQGSIIQLKDRAMALKILTETQTFLEKGLIQQPNVYRAHMTVARIGVMEMALSKENYSANRQRVYAHANASRRLNSQNPEPYFVLAHLYLLNNDFIQARKMVRAGIALAPTYDMGYSVANDINKLQPDTIFMKYVNQMKERWSMKK